MRLLKITVVDDLVFGITVPCGQSWSGYRHSEDVRIVGDRAMDHVTSCKACNVAEELGQEVLK